MILSNILRKRASTASTRESQDSRKRTCETTEQKATDINAAKCEPSAEISQSAETLTRRRSNRSKADNGSEGEGSWVEKKPRKRVQLLREPQKCCSCRRETRFRTDGICMPCGHKRCAECMLEGLQKDSKEPSST